MFLYDFRYFDKVTSDNIKLNIYLTKYFVVSYYKLYYRLICYALKCFVALVPPGTTARFLNLDEPQTL